MSAFQPANYEEALQRVKDRQQKPRTPLRPRSGIKASHRATLRKRAPVKKRVKRLSVGKLKKRAWIEFSVYIRTRDADEEGMVQCCTCDSVKHWKQMQAGHFISGRLNSNLFDERGCHAQCSKCNVIRGGNGPKYYQFMRDAYGEDVINELLRQNDQTHKWIPGELESIWQKYKALNEANPVVKGEL